MSQRRSWRHQRLAVIATVAAVVVACAAAVASPPNASGGTAPRFTIVFKGGGQETYSDHATMTIPGCPPTTSTESDTALERWDVTWKHVVLTRHGFSDGHGTSTFHSGVGGTVSSQSCDPTTGTLLPRVSGICGTTWDAAGPVTLEVKYYSHGGVRGFLPNKHSSAFLFRVQAVGTKEKAQHSGSQDCAAGSGAEAWAEAGFFTNSLKGVNRASKAVSEASRPGGSPDPIDCSAPASPVEQDHCTDEIHFTATVTIIREK